jgi:hypothetical protein
MFVAPPGGLPRRDRNCELMSSAEKRPSTDGLVDNVDPRSSHELDDDSLPKYEAPKEPAEIPFREKVITSFWIAINTLSTLGLIFLSKRYAYNAWWGYQMRRRHET